MVQIAPESNETFGGALLVVTEHIQGGVQGYVPVPASGGVQFAYYRAAASDIAYVGEAPWVLADDAPEAPA